MATFPVAARRRACYGGATMTRAMSGRSVFSGVMVAAVLSAAVAAMSLATDASEDHAVVGRWSITSDVGGAVWAFQPSGTVVVSGPGEIMSQGTWTEGPGDGAFDATVDVTVTGQELAVLGQVADEGGQVALYVTATEASRPDDWMPWPTESRVLGERLMLMVEETAVPSQPPLDCLRPRWQDGVVDWDRCDAVPTSPS